MQNVACTLVSALVLALVYAPIAMMALVYAAVA
jgi:hypothetical protein